MRTLRLPLFVLFCLAMVVGIAAPALPAPSGTSDLNQIRERLRQARERIEADRQKEDVLTREIEGYEAIVGQLEREVAALSTQEFELTRQLEEVTKRLEGLKEALVDKTRQLQEHESFLAARKRLLSTRVIDTYKRGPVAYAEVLLGSSEFSEFLTRIEFMKLIVNQDTELARTVRELVAQIALEKVELIRLQGEVEARQRELAERQAQVKVIIEDKAARQQEVLVAQNEREQIYRGVVADRREHEQIEADLTQASAAVEAQLNAYYAAQAAQAAPAVGSVSAGAASSPGGAPLRSGGRLVWPAPCCSGGTTYPGHPDNAIDIAGPLGSPIIAADSGTVLIATYGDNGGYGNYIVLVHAGGLSTIYAHFTSLAVGSGQSVARGQVIGAMGSTGRSSGSHLHFGVKQNGAAQNAWAYF